MKRGAWCANAAYGSRRALCCFAVAGLALGAAARLTADEDLRRLRLVELETELAKQKDIYLLLDAGAHRLAVKVRGMELAAFEVREMSRLVFEPLLGRAEPPPLPAPAVWTVVEGPGDTERETIAPTSLRPYSEEEEREEPAPTASPTAPAGKPAEGEPQTSYRVQLDIGWQLLVVDEPPRLGWAQRFAAAVRDGWQRLRGEQPSHPPLVALVMAPDDAKLLHHLFRAGTSILVVAAD